MTQTLLGLLTEEWQRTMTASKAAWDVYADPNAWTTVDERDATLRTYELAQERARQMSRVMRLALEGDK